MFSMSSLTFREGGADGLLVGTGGTVHQAPVNLPPLTGEYSSSSEAFFSQFS